MSKDGPRTGLGHSSQADCVIAIVLVTTPSWTGGGNCVHLWQVLQQARPRVQKIILFCVFGASNIACTNLAHVNTKLFD
jgi:hypothetical protein